MGTIDTIAADCPDDAVGQRLGITWLEKFRAGSAALRLWLKKRRSRATLRELTPEQLRDVGLTPDEVNRELAKSLYWR